MKNEWQKAPLILLPSSLILRVWVTDGTRTRDVQDHNLALYQLSYGHRVGHQMAPARGERKYADFRGCCQPDGGRAPRHPAFRNASDAL